ncbi:MAG: FAD-dependent oxidoreductase, partial [Syntrophobacteraceae bacterium]
MEKKAGVYICSGCGIGESLDLDALAAVAAKNKVSVCERNHFLCSPDGVASIRASIEKDTVNRVVIAACSQRVMADVFSFGPEVIVERVNLREQVVWSHPAGDEDTRMLAEDALRMGIVRARESEPPEPFMAEEPSKRILVVGGGLTGITAAVETARAGYEVVLVEKEESLGGYLGGVFRVPPSRPPYDTLHEPELDRLLDRLSNESRVKTYTGAQIESIEGGPCLFEAKIRQDGTSVSERVGAVILATGTVPYDAARLERLSFGTLPDVVAAPDVEAMFKTGEVKRPSNGQPVRSVAFVLCAGSRDPEHLPYCSSACCVESLKQAKYFKEADPQTPVYVFYRDMRSAGNYELLYRQLQKEGVLFVRGSVTGIEDDGSGLVVAADDELTRSPVLSEPVDLVVLATGMVPTTAFGEPFKPQAAAPEGEEETKAPADTILVSNLLNLRYRQGPELPALQYGFPDSHFICFPYESRRTGIYPAGSVRAPMDYERAENDAIGAALKAIQCVEMVSKGLAVHPRAGDASYPEFFMQRCTQCKRCTEECPFGAINEDEKANPLPNPTRCRRCGVCMGACPERIISFKNYSVSMIGNMIKSIEVPDEYEEKPRILALV